VSERLRRLSDEELGRALRVVGRDVDLPPTPAILPGVLARIAEVERAPAWMQPRLSLPSRRRTLVLVAAVLLLVAAVAVASRLVIHIGAVTIGVVPSMPTPIPNEFESPEVFGDPTPIADAGSRAGFAPIVPAALGPPDHVWVGQAQAGFDPTVVTTRIVMAWDPRPRLPAIDRLPWGAVLMELEGEAEIISKSVASDTGTLEPARVDGGQASWTSGKHAMEIATATGREVVLVTGNVLVWQEGPLTFRLETALPKGEAIGIAESIR
jgi:hypothetical protein